MWNKDTQSEVPGSSTASDSRVTTGPNISTGATRPVAPTAHPLACLGASVKVKGEISSDEDLQIDGSVEGPISLPSHRLIVGRTAHLSSEITAREVIVYGSVNGNLYSRDRVEIKKDGQMMGDIVTARISVEDGAYFKGRIEIEKAQSAGREEMQSANVPVGAEAN